jgi:hypothetical protein
MHGMERDNPDWNAAHGSSPGPPYAASSIALSDLRFSCISRLNV